MRSPKPTISFPKDFYPVNNPTTSKHSTFLSKGFVGDGVDRHFRCDNQAFNIADTSVDFTLSMWAIMSAESDGRALFSYVNGFSSGNQGFVLLGGYTGSDNLILRLNAGGEISFGTIPKYVPVHIAWCRRNTKNLIFVNGKATREQLDISFNPQTECSMYLGKAVTYTGGHWEDTSTLYNRSAIFDFWFLKGKAVWFDSPFQPPMKQSVDRSSLLVTPSIQQSLGVR